MNTPISKIALSICLALSTAGSIQAQQITKPSANKREGKGEELRDWTITDSVSVRYFSGWQDHPEWWPANLGENTDSPTFVTPSRDGERFFFLTNHPVLARDSNIYELTVFSSAAVRRALDSASAALPKPLATVSFESFSSKLPGLRNARWEDDGRAIVFEAMTAKGKLQVHRLDIGTATVKKLTDSTEGVVLPTYRGGGVLYGVYLEKPVEPPILYPMVAVPREPSGLPIVMLPSGLQLVLEATFEGGAAKQFQGEFADRWISPDGRHAVALQSQEGVQRFVLLDLQQGGVSVLLDAPVGATSLKSHGGAKASVAPPQALWTSDAKSVILVNTMLPASEGGAAGGSAIVDYELSTQRWQVIGAMLVEREGVSPRAVTAVGGLKPEQGFVLTQEGGGTKAHTVYRKQGARWAGRAVNAAEAQRATREPEPQLKELNVFIRESANDPPVLMASDGRRERALTLTEEDPALKRIWRARVEPLRFKSPEGGEVTGRLLRPRGVTKDQALPVVIQLEGHVDLDHFLPDGRLAAGFAAQVFVAQGYAVVEIPSINAASRKREGVEGPAIVARLEAALDALAARQRIDRKRVAAVGHSRTGFQVHYMATHPARTRLAAIAAVDSYTGTYGEVLQRAGAFVSTARQNGIGSRDGVHNLMTGGSFWEQKGAWLEHDNSFNLDRSRTPALFAMHFAPPGLLNAPVLSPQSAIIGVSDAVTTAMIGAYNLANIPAEFLWLPEANHYLLRPKERVAEMGAVVDWVNFWLKDQVPADSSRAARWQPLRAQQRELMKRPLPPRVKWQAATLGAGS